MTDVMEDRLSQTLIDFAKDYCEYLPREVPRLNYVPSSTEFLNEYVNTNTPFVMECLDPSVMHSDIYEKWRKDNYFLYVKNMYHDEMTVAVTPSGYADGVQEDLGYFMVPEERKIEMYKFMSQLSDHTEPGVFYLQKQNNNYIDEFPHLHNDVKEHVPWASEAFGARPDATNIWIGNADSLTSMHKDHYENLYYVITGQKTFTLYPPIANMWLPYKNYKKYQYFYNKDKKDFEHVDLNEEVKWITPKRIPETKTKQLIAMNTKSYEVTVNAGETLYLPSLWYHEVKQGDRTIAVNYWYDMKYELKFPYFCLLETLSNQ